MSIDEFIRVFAVVDMAQTMASMATPVVAGLGGSALAARRTSAKVELKSGKRIIFSFMASVAK